MNKAEQLTILQQNYLSCGKCDLCHTRNQVVFGFGNLDAKLMIIGQSPGVEEDKAGRPFVGISGKLLNYLLTQAKLDRLQIYITNTLLCYVKPGISTKDDQIMACRNRLQEEIGIIKPTVIVTLGAPALYALCWSKDSIWRNRKPKQLSNGIWHVATYHPAAALYHGDKGKGIIDNIITDLRKAKLIIDILERKTDILPCLKTWAFSLTHVNE